MASKRENLDAASISLGVQPNVDLTLRITSDFDDDSRLLTFEVEGPQSAVDFLRFEISKQQNNMMAFSSDVIGYMSPKQKITMTGESKDAAGVPAAATFVAFMYPLPDLKDTVAKLIDEGHSEPWLFMCLLGGFCYFDSIGHMIQCNALVLTAAPPVSLTLVGPYQASKPAVEHLISHSRMREVTIAALRNNGFQQFGWVLAQETPGGARATHFPRTPGNLEARCAPPSPLNGHLNRALWPVLQGSSCTRR